MRRVHRNRDTDQREAFERKKAQLEAAELELIWWKQSKYVTAYSPILAALVVAVATLVGAWLAGYFDRAKVNLENEKLALQQSIATLRSDQTQLKENVALLSKRIVQDALYKTHLTEMVVPCDDWLLECACDSQEWVKTSFASGKRGEAVTGRQALAYYINRLNRFLSNGIPSFASTETAKTLSLWDSALKKGDESAIAELLQPVEELFKPTSSTLSDLDLLFMVRSDDYRRICRDANLDSSTKEYDEIRARVHQVYSSRIAVWKTFGALQSAVLAKL